MSFWYKEDYNRLQFILAEYLGMQSSKLDKKSLQELHEFVHKALNEYWTMTNKEKPVYS